MPSVDYYRDQARLLLSLALVTNDSEYAAQLEARARIYLALADIKDDPTAEFGQILDGFNDEQMSKG